MRKIWTLYPCLLLCVLLSAGCSTDADDAAPVEATQATTSTAQPASTETKRIVVLGNSLAAGYGLSPQQAFPALIQQKIDALGWNFEVVNAGVSGETTAGGLSRIDWLLREPVDVLILELGGNDGLRGIATEVTQRNLQGIIDKTRARYPEARIVLAGMQVPPNLGTSYSVSFREIYPTLAESNDAALIPFLLEGVGGRVDLNQADRIHPTAAGQEIVAENVWKTLKPVLEEIRRPA